MAYNVKSWGFGLPSRAIKKTEVDVTKLKLPGRGRGCLVHAHCLLVAPTHPPGLLLLPPPNFPTTSECFLRHPVLATSNLSGSQVTTPRSESSPYPFLVTSAVFHDCLGKFTQLKRKETVSPFTAPPFQFPHYLQWLQPPHTPPLNTFDLG